VLATFLGVWLFLDACYLLGVCFTVSTAADRTQDAMPGSRCHLGPLVEEVGSNRQRAGPAPLPLSSSLSGLWL
jgi:hypothetical protein